MAEQGGFVPIRRLTVFGVGLIGGSLTLALKAAGAVVEVTGVGRSLSSLKLAREHGLIDRMTDNAAEALEGAEVVMLAMPVGQMDSVMRAIAPHLRPGMLVTDAGSTKQDVVSLMRQHLGAHLRDCVPGHPVAGAELSGPLAARADLYQRRNVVLTPLAESDPAGVQRIAAMWRQCGAQVRSMTAAEHDAIFAAVSHLPHLLAYALVDMIAARDNAGQLFDFAASGFRDFTRIAGSSPEMWRDIALANREALLAELDAYLVQVGQLRAALQRGDGAALEATFAQARSARQDWLDRLR